MQDNCLLNHRENFFYIQESEYSKLRRISNFTERFKSPNGTSIVLSFRKSTCSGLVSFSPVPSWKEITSCHVSVPCWPCPFWELQWQSSGRKRNEHTMERSPRVRPDSMSRELQTNKDVGMDRQRTFFRTSGSQ